MNNFSHGEKYRTDVKLDAALPELPAFIRIPFRKADILLNVPTHDFSAFCGTKTIT